MFDETTTIFTFPPNKVNGEQYKGGSPWGDPPSLYVQDVMLCYGTIIEACCLYRLNVFGGGIQNMLKIAVCEQIVRVYQQDNGVMLCNPA